MNSISFFKNFPDEQSCKTHLKNIRENEGVFCKKCESTTKHWWLEKVGKFQCSECNSRTNLKSGTIMENSKVSLHKWFLCIHYMTSTKKPISCLELQRQLEIPDYITIWKMMNKIRMSMGKRDSEYKLKGTVEIDEGFFEVVNLSKKDELGNRIEEKKEMKRGRGSERQMKVLVMVESEPREQTQRYEKTRKMGYVKMVILDDLTGVGINYEIEKSVDRFSHIKSDNSTSYSKLKDVVDYHTPSVIKKTEVMKKLPWVHTMISNCKRELLGVHHSVRKEFLQNYLNEFCYKVNRRNFSTDLFDRLLLCSVQN